MMYFYETCLTSQDSIKMPGKYLCIYKTIARKRSRERSSVSEISENERWKVSVVVHTCGPGYSGDAGGRITGANELDQPGQWQDPSRKRNIFKWKTEGQLSYQNRGRHDLYCLHMLILDKQDLKSKLAL